METDYIIRQLKYTANKHRNDTLRTFDTNITALCNDVIPKLELLEKYEQEEKNGLLLRLPCKVGAVVYELQECFDVETGCRGECDSCPKKMNISEVKVRTKAHAARIEERGYIGKTAFLTREEAEAKLAEMEGGHE